MKAPMARPSTTPTPMLVTVADRVVVPVEVSTSSTLVPLWVVPLWVVPVEEGPAVLGVSGEPGEPVSSSVTLDRRREAMAASPRGPRVTVSWAWPPGPAGAAPSALTPRLRESRWWQVGCRHQPVWHRDYWSGRQGDGLPAWQLTRHRRSPGCRCWLACRRAPWLAQQLRDRRPLAVGWLRSARCRPTGGDPRRGRLLRMAATRGSGPARSRPGGDRRHRGRGRPRRRPDDVAGTSGR